MRKKSKKLREVSFFKPAKAKKKPQKVFLSAKFPPYLTSHTKPQNLRKYVANKKRLGRMDNNPFQAWGKPKSMPKKDMTWPQAKIRFPKLKPMVDTDRDGVINLLDCRPFDRRLQHVYYHGTTALQALGIKKKGLKPAKQLPKHFKTSEKTESEKVYVFKQPHHAKTYADVVTRATGLGKPEVLEVDIDPKELEEDLESGYGEAYKKKGMVKSEKIKTYEGDTSYPEEKEDLYEKAEEGTLTPEDIEEHELKNFKKDYDLKDEDEITLDYDEEQEDDKNN